MKISIALFLAAVLALPGCCCPTYQFETYDHAETKHLQNGIEAQSFAGDLKDFSADGILFAPYVRSDGEGSETKRWLTMFLYSEETTSIFVSKAVLETADKKDRVEIDVQQTVVLDKGVYQKPFFRGSLALFRAGGKGLGDIEDLERMWGTDTVVLHLWVGGTKEDPAQKKLSFRLKLNHRRDIAWPT
jgi:hypothetical protein